MSRACILAGIRATLDAATSTAVRRQSVTERLERPIEHPRPRRAMRGSEERLRQFKDFQHTLGVEIIAVDSVTAIPTAIASYLQALGLPPRVRRGSDPQLAGMPWDTAPGLVVETGPAQGGDTAGLSRAVAGVAETGTLVLASGPGNPVTLGFLPDVHVVVLRADAIVGSYEEACALVLAESAGALPRTLNLVTGASRTGDIGGKIVMGAHGPRRLAVILVAGEQ